MRLTSRRRETTYSDYEVVPVQITERAVRLVLLDVEDPDPEGVWVPKSCIHEEYRDTLEVGVIDTIEIADWFMEKEGLGQGL